MALVLTRRINETIVIETPWGPVVVTVSRIEGGEVKLDVDAPACLKILRGELNECEHEEVVG